MSELVVNCCGTPLGSTLGVAHGLLQLCSALARDHELTFVATSLGEIDDTQAGDLIRRLATRVVDAESARRDDARYRTHAIELLPHHFQMTQFCDRSIVMCHDLHAFDLPWKYRQQAQFRRVLGRASAVITHFPRTYYAVEQIAGISVMNLFLTESPLLIDTSPALTSSTPVHRDGSPTCLLYPAQLQPHKNHDALVRGVLELHQLGHDSLSIVCPGSEFKPEITRELRALVSEHDLDRVFEFPGRVSDAELVDLYRRCDAVIVPSLAEGGAYVALEAIAAGKPVAVNAIESAVMHADAMHAEVIWFDAQRPDSTADAMAALMTADPAHWLQRNADCRNRISRLSWNDVAQKWNTVLDMIDGRRGRPITLADRWAREIELV